MAIVDLFVKSGSSPRLSADDATVQHQIALLLHGDYTKWAWLYSLVWLCFLKFSRVFPGFLRTVENSELCKFT